MEDIKISQHLISDVNFILVMRPLNMQPTKKNQLASNNQNMNLEKCLESRHLLNANNFMYEVKLQKFAIKDFETKSVFELESNLLVIKVQ